MYRMSESEFMQYEIAERRLQERGEGEVSGSNIYNFYGDMLADEVYIDRLAEKFEESRRTRNLQF